SSEFHQQQIPNNSIKTKTNGST
ncbi:unnamed protein product, partial [Rotaria magnacalcarata]